MKNVTISLEEYQRLLKCKKIVEMVETELHDDDVSLEVARIIEEKIKQGEIQVKSEKEIMDVLG